MPVVKGKNPAKKYTARWQDPGHAQREKSFATRKEALDHLTAMEHGKRAGTYADPKRGAIPFGQYAERWIARTPGSTTETSYRRAFNCYCDGLKSRTLQAVAMDREGIQDLIDSAPAGSRAIIRCVVVGTCNEAVKNGRIASHLLHGLRIPQSMQRADFHMITRPELDKLSKGMGTFSLLPYLMFALGLRIGEALALSRDDFIDDGKVCRISKQRREDGQTVAPKARKAGDFRDVPVPAWLYDMVRDHVGSFFRDEHRSVTSKRFRQGRDAAGLPESFVPHHLRHAYASVMLAAGIPITDLARYMGHHDIRTTFQVYSHLVPSSMDMARKALEAA